MKKGCQENKPGTKQTHKVNTTNVILARTKTWRRLNIRALTRTRSRQNRDGHSEDSTDNMGQRCRACSDITVDPRLGFTFPVGHVKDHRQPRMLTVNRPTSGFHPK